MPHFNVRLSDEYYEWCKTQRRTETIIAVAFLAVMGLVLAGFMFLPNISLYLLTGSFDLCTLPARSC